jgi:hypothetical protein
MTGNLMRPAADAPWRMSKSLLTRITNMEAERINLIGLTLADLSARTDALRGYL